MGKLVIFNNLKYQNLIGICILFKKIPPANVHVPRVSLNSIRIANKTGVAHI